MRRRKFDWVNANRRAKQEARQPNRSFSVHTDRLPGHKKRSASKRSKWNPYAPPIECEDGKNPLGLYFKLKSKRKSRGEVSKELKGQFRQEVRRHQMVVMEHLPARAILDRHMFHALDIALVMLVGSKESRQALMELGISKDQMNSWRSYAEEHMRKLFLRTAGLAITITSFIGVLSYYVSHNRMVDDNEGSWMSGLVLVGTVGCIILGSSLYNAWKELRGSGWSKAKDILQIFEDSAREAESNLLPQPKA